MRNHDTDHRQHFRRAEAETGDGMPLYGYAVVAMLTLGALMSYPTEAHAQVWQGETRICSRRL